jgi:hypothetical protein
LRNARRSGILEKRRRCRAERRVRLRPDALRAEVGEKLVLRVVQMELELVAGGDDRRRGEDFIQLELGKVRDADAARLSCARLAG